MRELLLIKVKRLKDVNDKVDPTLPKFGKVGDAGADLTATRIIDNNSFGVTYGTSIAVEIPEGHVGLIFPRSSIRNTELVLSNSVGVIDSGYRGEIMCTFNKTNGLDSIAYKAGDRICQMIIIPYPDVDYIPVMELTDSERGTNGFGSTGS